MARPPTSLRWSGALVLGVAAVVCAPSAARATEVEDFARARAAYEERDFARAASLFEAMVGGPVPAIEDEVLIEESIKYLAATYVFLGRREAAERQFEELLRRRPSYTINRAAFPPAVYEVYDSVRRRMERARREEEARRLSEAEQREAERRAALLALLDLAQVDEVTIRHDPAIAWIPFGAGQFQNGNEGLGAFFFSAEALALLSAVVTLSIWVPLSDAHYEAGALSTIDVGVLRGLQIANLVSLGAFGALVVAGIVEAHVSFVPSHTVRREREIPTDVLDRLELSVGPGSIGLRLSF